MAVVYLILGGNLGEPRTVLGKAMEAIERKLGSIDQRSSWYETEAWGVEDQPNYLNLVIELETSKTPQDLLTIIQAIESEFGRNRAEEGRWGSRTLDIDILLYGNEVIRTASLVIPHERMAERRFVLEPLSEIAGEVIHPILGVDITTLKKQCEDTSRVQKLLES